MKRTTIAVAACVLAVGLIPLQGVAQGKKKAPAATPAKSAAGGWVVHFDNMKPYTAEDGTKGQMTLKMGLKNTGMGPYCRYEGQSTLKSVGAKEMVAAGVELVAEKVSLQLDEVRTTPPPLVPPKSQVRGLRIYSRGTIVYRLKEIETLWGKSAGDLGTATFQCVLHSPTAEQYEEMLKGGAKPDLINNTLFIEMTDPAGQVFIFQGTIKKGQ